MKILIACVGFLVFSLGVLFLSSRLNENAMTTSPKDLDAERMERYRLQEPLPEPMRHRVSDETFSKIASVYQRLLVAYTNDQPILMREIENEMPSEVEKMLLRDWKVVEREFYDALNLRFLRSEQMVAHHSLAALEAFLDANTEAVRFVGNILLSRKDYFEGLLVLDRNTYRRLVNYRDHYASLGKLDMLNCVERHLAQWQCQIEDSRGFTRSYMAYMIRREYPHVMEGSWTFSKLLAVVRAQAKVLMSYGYTPKWLDEEFPMPQSDSATKAGNLPK